MSQGCTHQVLVKVVDRLGMMTSTYVDGRLVTAAPVLQAHYECRDCRAVLLTTANPEAQVAYEAGLSEHITAVVRAIDGVRTALSQRKREP